MMSTIDPDTLADDEIYRCLDLDNPKSFFLFAGAGSGKTRSLVEVLKRFREDNIHRLRINSQQVAIITYTNAACDEIKRRLEFDPAFNISTIHSFAWELIKPYTHDIRKKLKERLISDIKDLTEAQRKGRAGTKAAEDRPRQIETKRTRLELLNSIKKFNYNPNSDNSDKDSLNHAEVIDLTASLLLNYPLLQSILIRKFPILLIDESQDTNKELLEALFTMQNAHKNQFLLGLFGDIMQRIYTDGKENLGIAPLPEGWLSPQKNYNYRCSRRIVTLINKIREDVDKNRQESRKSDEGFVRLFIADTNQLIEKSAFETAICEEMARLSGDELWKSEIDNNKILILEHHMAAQRGGFLSFFNPLYNVDKFKTGLLDGSLSGITFFSEKVIPLINYLEAGNNFAVTRILSKHSPLMLKENILGSESPKAELVKAKEAVNALYTLWDNGTDPTLYCILKAIQCSGLFKIPDSLALITKRKEIEYKTDNEMQDPMIEAWENALKSRFSEFKEYVRYISEETQFATHQGIKGLEFPRVMVILDDEEARGFLFSYDKLFGAKEPTKTDFENKDKGKETSIDRTRRLFYVTCSRAEKSLAIIAYTNQPEKVKKNALEQEWFSEEEIIMSEDIKI